MTNEQIQQATERFNALPLNQKQEVWDNAIERLSKINVDELGVQLQEQLNGGNSLEPPKTGGPTIFFPEIKF